MRTQNSIKNFVVGIGGNIINLALGFFSRYFFLLILSVEYLGVSGLFSSILTMLSFAELGIGTAIVYSLYKPLAEENTDEVNAIMQFFKKVYNIIGVIVLTAGMALLPFLDFFITDRRGIENLELIYALYVFNTAVSYFFSYNRSLMTADQKAYKLAIIDYLYRVLYIVCPLLTLWMTHNYIVYLCTQIVTTFFWNVVVYYKVQREYPILRDKQKKKISVSVKKDITRNTAAMMIYKVAIVITSGTDNLLISKFFGIATVGLCSNYTLVIQNMSSLLSQGINAITASVGNMSATENDDKKYKIFNVVFFINFWIYSYASLGLLFCLNPLIAFCFGEEYVVSYSIVIPMVVSFFLLGMQSTTSLFRDAQGLFWQGKLRPIAQTLVNLGSSILLTKLTGDVGMIFWGTAISRLVTNFWYDPYVVFKNGFHKPLFPYFKRYAIYVISIVPLLGICDCAVQVITFSSALLSVLVNALLVTLIVNGGLFLIFYKTDEFSYLKQNVLKKLKIKGV